ncbi:MAG: YafY family transcriptional regulator [Ktedonobacteraceae bacterium]|nr:YafY family transcriptional regulator [Ktedonobacteraceae bacterium]
MRADRLVSILLLLQVHQRLTARTLAKRLEVSERTIHRDMEALSVAGIPVIAERGTGGGWGLLEDYRTNLTGLNEAEIQSLFLSQPSHLLADLGLHQASEAALIKLLAALPVLHRRDAEYVRQRIHIDGTGWHQSEENVSSLSILQEAIWQERKLLLSYQRGDSVTVERVVDPLGLVAKGSTWYLVASVEGEMRSYRVSRVRSATLTGQPCVRPGDFDLAAYWSQSASHFVANLPRYHVTVRIAPEMLEHIYHAGRYARIEHVEPAGEDGWITLRLQFEMEEAACGYLLSFGTQVEILEPPALRAKVICLAERVAAFYAQRPDPLCYGEQSPAS